MKACIVVIVLFANLVNILEFDMKVFALLLLAWPGVGQETGVFVCERATTIGSENELQQVEIV